MFFWPLMDTMPPGEVLAKACPMWTDWPDIKHGYRCDSKRQAPKLVKARGAKIEEGGAMHPSLFQRPPADGLRQLVEAPQFIMARKFAANATVPGAERPEGLPDSAEVPLGVFMRSLLLLPS